MKPRHGWDVREFDGAARPNKLGGLVKVLDRKIFSDTIGTVGVVHKRGETFVRLRYGREQFDRVQWHAVFSIHAPLKFISVMLKALDHLFNGALWTFFHAVGDFAAHVHDAVFPFEHSDTIIVEAQNFHCGSSDLIASVLHFRSSQFKSRDDSTTA